VSLGCFFINLMHINKINKSLQKRIIIINYPFWKLIYLYATFTSESESESESELSESLSELETIKVPDPMAFSNCNDNLCSRLGQQQQHFQPNVCISDKHSAPMFLFIQVVQNNVLHFLQLTKSLPPPHHPQ